MILRPCSYDLATAVRRLEEDPRIAFELTRRTVPLPGEANHEDWPVITTLDMWGPKRSYAEQNPKGDGYKGPIWKSDVRLSSRFRTVDKIFDHIIDHTLGMPHYGDIGDVDGELILRYDFPVDLQPDNQPAPAPHIVYLKLSERKGRHSRNFGSIGDLRNKILITPELYLPFYQTSPEEIALARAELAKT